MPNPNRHPKVQFRLENEIYAALQLRVRQLRAQGTITTVDQYARALVLAALGEEEKIVFADEVVLRAHRAKHKIAEFIGQLIEDNVAELVRVAGEEG